MCTATWLATGEELLFLFNRDERRTRPRGIAPRSGEREGTRYISPIDAAAGGTWTAVSENGLLFALLNRSGEGAPPVVGAVSRGTLIPSLVATRSLARAAAKLAALDLGALAPFRLVVRDGGGNAMTCFDWDGERLESGALDPSTGLLCSSSLGDARVTRARTPQWERLFVDGHRPSAAALRAFHRSHEPERSADSVCMHRDDAETVSHVEIRIEPGLATMSYTDGSPCTSELSFAADLELAR